MIRVLIVDNLIEENIQHSSEVHKFINEQPDIKLITPCSSASQAVQKLGDVDVLIVGTNLAKDGAYWLVQTIARGNHPVHPLVLGRTETNKTIIRYLEAGACGYFRRNDPVEQMPENIRRAANGEVILPQEILPSILSRLNVLSQYIDDISRLSNQLACLTPREREVLQLIGRNYSNRDIADMLIIEVGTVKNHVHSILSKLNVSSRREAALYLPPKNGLAEANIPNPTSGLSAIARNSLTDFC